MNHDLLPFFFTVMLFNKGDRCREYKFFPSLFFLIALGACITVTKLTTRFGRFDVKHNFGESKYVELNDLVFFIPVI